MSRKGIGDYEVPFYQGHQSPTVSYRNQKDPATGLWSRVLSLGYTMEPNEDFQDRLIFVSQFGPSHMQMERQNGQKVLFMLSDFCKMIPYMKNGVVYGLFTYTKRGTAYGTRLVEPRGGWIET